MSKPTLLQEIEQFLYTHAPNMLHKKVLLAVVRKWEGAYQERIEELERVPVVNEFDRMVSEGGPPTKLRDRPCDCGIYGSLAPCRWCIMSDREFEEHERQGNYESFD